MTKVESEMTPESVDPQQRQRNKNQRSEARQRKIKSMAAVAKEEVRIWTRGETEENCEATTQDVQIFREWT